MGLHRKIVIAKYEVQCLQHRCKQISAVNRCCKPIQTLAELKFERFCLHRLQQKYNFQHRILEAALGPIVLLTVGPQKILFFCINLTEKYWEAVNTKTVINKK